MAYRLRGPREALAASHWTLSHTGHHWRTGGREARGTGTGNTLENGRLPCTSCTPILCLLFAGAFVSVTDGKGCSTSLDTLPGGRASGTFPLARLQWREERKQMSALKGRYLLVRVIRVRAQSINVDGSCTLKRHSLYILINENICKM